MTTYQKRELNQLGGLTLRASVARPVVSNRPEHAANAHLNPMIMKSISWRELGMVCGQAMTVKISDIGGTDVTFTKFSTRVGPGSASPPV